MAITTITKALKKLYKAIIGEDTTKNDPTKIICELADNWSGGGGGSSDFSTAEVTVVTGAKGIVLSGGIEGTSEGTIFIKSTEYGDIGVTTLRMAPQSTGTAKALLFKNLDTEIPHEFVAFFTVVEGSILTVDGNCEIVDEGVFIWGDCTITSSDK